VFPCAHLPFAPRVAARLKYIKDTLGALNSQNNGILIGTIKNRIRRSGGSARDHQNSPGRMGLKQVIYP
jgi:hypothetical protein